jgi:deoxyribodipyrimidine photolyase-related protein
MLGVHPKQVHEWYLAVYVDAVEWVELPNSLGMSQFADGGIMASKPYAATGKYIQRMSNYCQGCPYDPAKAVGEDACPFTTLYWDFLARHQELLSGNPRMSLQVRNLERKSSDEVRAIHDRATTLRQSWKV